MIFSYVSGAEILARYKELFAQEQCKIILFFLGTGYDKTFIEDVKRISNDLDALTGSHALAVAFNSPPAIPPEGARNPLGFRASGEYHQWADWSNYASEMTEKIYKLAECFDVRPDHLPCLLFVVPHPPQDFAVVRLFKNRLYEDVYPKLREIFGDWFREQKGVHQLRLLANGRWRDGNRPRVKFDNDMLRNFLREEVCPIVQKECVEQIISLGVDAEETRRAFARLDKQPTSIRPVVDFLKKHDLSVSIRGEHINAETFSQAYRELVKHMANIALEKAVQVVPDFPLKKVEELNKSYFAIYIGQLARKYGPLGGNVFMLVSKIFGI